jgi:hypothetical protein
MALILSGSVDVGGSMTATTILVSAPGAGGMLSSSQQIQNYNTFAVTSSANTFYGNQTINGLVDVTGSLNLDGVVRITGSSQLQTYNSLGTTYSDRISLVVDPTEFENTTTSTTNNIGIYSKASTKGSNTGGVTAYGGYFETNTYAVSTGGIGAYGIYNVTQRNNGLDTSTNSSNSLIGVVSSTRHGSTLHTSSITTNVYGFQSGMQNLAGRMITGSALLANLNVAVQPNQTASMGDYYGIYTNANIGATSGTGTATLTNYYDAYLRGTTVRATGTVTNKWGVYQLNSAHSNYFAGNTGIGKTPSATLDVVGNAFITGSLKVSGSLIVGGTDVTHYIGESYGGGIVFYVYDGGKHGLIAATSDQSTGTTWYNGGYAAANAPFDGINAGIRNTTSITTVYQTGSYAAEICAFFNGGNFGDWYLPSKYELNLLYQQKTIVGGFANETYWSSTELHPNNARASTQTFTNGVQNNHDKSSTFYVRAIRAF